MISHAYKEISGNVVPDAKCGESTVNICEEHTELSTAKGLTYKQYKDLTPEEMMKLQNRIRRKALRVREGDPLPSDYTMFMLVTLHLFKNAHRYFNLSSPSDLHIKLLESRFLSSDSEGNLENFQRGKQEN